MIKILVIILTLNMLSSCIKQNVANDHKVIIKRQDLTGRTMNSTEKEPVGKVQGDNVKGQNSSGFVNDLDDLYSKMINSQEKSKSGGIFKMCIMVPLSGINASIGQAVLDGAKMAMFDSNVQNFTILPIDTHITTMENAAKYITDQNVDVVVGPVFSNEVDELSKQFRMISAPIITLSNNRNLVKYGNVEVFGVSVIDKVKVAMNYASQLNRYNVAVLLKSDLGGKDLQDAIQTVAKTSKFAMMSYNFYDNSELRIQSAIKSIANNSKMIFNVDQFGKPYLVNLKIAAKQARDEKYIKPNQSVRNLDVIITDAGGNTLDAIISAIDNEGLMKRDILIISLSDNVNPGILNNGVKFITYDREKFNIFTKIFYNTYKANPSHFAGLGYDITGVLATLFNSNSFTRKDLHDASGFSGVSGEFRFGSKNIVERKYSIYEISEGRVLKIE